jgi:2-polyprenyl-6-methoxyphenol hydroxylase-like FAD-dependent oxidoreductase
MNAMPFPMVNVDVVIIGGGVSGLTIACDLARRGVRIRIVEKSMTPFQGSGGVGIQPRTIELFEQLGIVRPLQRAGATYPSMRLHMSTLGVTHRKVKLREASPDVPYPNDWLVPQWRTEQVLRQRLSELGRQVEFGAEVLSIEQDNEGATVRVQCRGVAQSIRSRYVVCTDGGQRPVRKPLGAKLARSASREERMIVGDVRASGVDRACWHVWPSQDKGVIGLCPLPHSDLFQLVMPLDDTETEPALSEQAIQARWLAATGLEDIRLHCSGWLSIVCAHAGSPKRYRSGRVFHAGGADFAQLSGGSLDLNKGIQDAYNLGWKLAFVLNGSPEALLDTYESERRAAMADMWSKQSQWIKGAPVSGLSRGRRQLHLGPGYSGSAISVTSVGAHAGRLRAGDRAPDAPCARQQTGQTTLFDEFRAGHFSFTVLAFGANAIKALGACRWRDAKGYLAMVRLVAIRSEHLAEDANALVDEGRHARNAYGVADDENIAFLIRPDGYIGLIASDDWARSVRMYLERVAGFSLNPEEAPPERIQCSFGDTGAKYAAI